MSILINHQGLNEAVQDYFTHHRHPEYTKVFELDRIEVSDKNHNILHAVPKGLEPEDIRQQHNGWERRLQLVGNQYGLDLRLPYWAFEK
jgi:hypothetical protein